MFLLLYREKTISDCDRIPEFDEDSEGEKAAIQEFVKLETRSLTKWLHVDGVRDYKSHVFEIWKMRTATLASID